MAENKKGFLLYADQKSLFDKLPDELAGRLIKLIFCYVNDENPDLTNEDLILQIAFEPIKIQLKRDLKSWEKEIINKQNAGKLGNLKRWKPEIYELVIKGEISIMDALKMADYRSAIVCDSLPSQSIAKIAVNVNDNVNVNVNDNIDIPKEKKIKKKKEPEIIWDYEFIKKFVVDEKGFPEPLAQRIFEYYSTNDWKDSRNKKIVNLKQKILANWLSEENKLKFKENASTLNKADRDLAEYFDRYSKRQAKRNNPANSEQN